MPGPPHSIPQLVRGTLGSPPGRVAEHPGNVSPRGALGPGLIDQRKMQLAAAHGVPVLQGGQEGGERRRGGSLTGRGVHASLPYW
jgi:hypothetical protein